ncbi:AAA family ATPase [Candidatus Woesearchaeota archaeon]|nr:AAA family ATPase [Candidatus Woesearchaeota archaeon]
MSKRAARDILKSHNILIAITGSPGVGKSTLAKILTKELGFDRLDLHHYYKRISTGYNQSKQSYDVDYQKFEKLVKEKLKEAKNGLVIDSHISHLLPKKLVDLCIVLICSDLKKLEKRLKMRKYTKKKIRENLDAEIFQICLMETKEKKHKYLWYDTDKKMNKNAIVNEVCASLRKHR